jgi:hypothetical protein
MKSGGLSSFPLLDHQGLPACSEDSCQRDGWSGEVKKFIITTPDKDLFFSTDDVAEATETVIQLKVAVET